MGRRRPSSTPENASAPAKLVGWRARPGSSPPSSTGSPRSSTSAARNASPPPLNASRSDSNSTVAPPRAAIGHRVCATPITKFRGARAATRASPTDDFYVRDTTLSPTAPPTSTTGRRPATRGRRGETSKRMRPRSIALAAGSRGCSSERRAPRRPRRRGRVRATGLRDQGRRSREVAAGVSTSSTRCRGRPWSVCARGPRQRGARARDSGGRTAWGNPSRDQDANTHAAADGIRHLERHFSRPSQRSVCLRTWVELAPHRRGGHRQSRSSSTRAEQLGGVRVQFWNGVKGEIRRGEDEAAVIPEVDDDVGQRDLLDPAPLVFTVTTSSTRTASRTRAGPPQTH